MTRSTGSTDNRQTPSDSASIAEQVQRIRAEQQALIARLNAGEKRFRSLAKAVWMVQEEERRSLARELHDGIGQTLTALKNQLERLRLRDIDDDTAAGLKDSVELVSMALNDTRELSRLLRPAVLDDLGLGAALAWLSRTLGRRAAMTIDVNYELGELRLSPDIETLVFRVTQEALTNIIKHAATARAYVDVKHDGVRLRVCVRDEGVGFDPAEAIRASDNSESLGLRGIRDRLELFGGRFELTSSPGQGCTLVMTLPLRDNGVPQVGEEK